METSAIEKKVQEGIKSKVKLYPDGKNRYKVFTPFVYDDGDHLGIVLKKDTNGWVLSDEGATYMRLTLEIDEEKLFDPNGNRNRILVNTLSSYKIFDRNGELVTPVYKDDYGAALYRLAQGLIKVSDIDYLSREIVSSTFLDDFKELISESVSENRYDFNWYDSDLDIQKVYSVDCRINSMAKPLFVYALNNDAKVLKSALGIVKFRQWNVSFMPIGIFENRKSIANKTVNMFLDVCDRSYSSMEDNEEKIKEDLRELTAF